MAILAAVWTGLTGLTALVWLLRHVLIARINRVLPPIRPDADATGDDLPLLTLIVAAKDEEPNIERCIRSVLAQTYPGLRIIAVNDRSDDRTGAILDALAAEDARLTPIHVTQLREGWFGKNNAMREGVERADTPWMCFTDADCTFQSPHALATAVRHALAHGSAFLSILPVLDAQGVLEQMIQPACGGILLIWFNPLLVNNPRRKAAYANGAFMLMTRNAYEAMGGHEPVKTEVNEDMHLARIAKEKGLALRVVPNDGLYRVRMYTDFAQMWRGWSRIFYGCFGSARKIILSMLMVAIFGLLPWASLIAGGAAMGFSEPRPSALTEPRPSGSGSSEMAARSADPVPSKSPPSAPASPLAAASSINWPLLFWLAAASCFLQMTVMVRYYRQTHIPAWLAPTYPIAAALGVGMLFSALMRLKGRGTTTWRGTTYRADAVVR
jgi:glycosyltransferase involved in cell wall biosynthesis